MQKLLEKLYSQRKEEQVHQGLTLNVGRDGLHQFNLGIAKLINVNTFADVLMKSVIIFRSISSITSDTIGQLTYAETNRCCWSVMANCRQLGRYECKRWCLSISGVLTSLRRSWSWMWIFDICYAYSSWRTIRWSNTIGRRIKTHLIQLIGMHSYIRSKLYAHQLHGM